MDAMATERSSLEVPDEVETRRAVEKARRLYQRTLAAWAGDAMTLRRSGTSEPTWCGTQERRAA